MEALELVFLVLAAFGCALLGAYLGSINKRAWTGLFLGLFLGPIGLIIILLIPRKKSLDNFMGRYSPDETIPKYARTKPVLDLSPETKIGHVESTRQVRENIEALLNLKKLLDAGVVTQEEFDLKKKVLLKDP